MADRIGRWLGTWTADPDFGVAAAPSPPYTNGHHPAETKSDPVRTVSYFSPDNLRTVYQLGGTSSDVDEVSRATAFGAAIYAYAAMTWRAEKYSEPPLLVVQLTDDDEDEWLPDHELAGLLDMPHPDLDMGELLYQTRLYRDATGAALWVKDLDRAGRVGRLTPFSADEFTVKRAGGRMFGEFRVQTAGGIVELPAERCVYFREPGPSAWSRGTAPLDVALHTLNLGKQATATVKSILKNALFPSVVVQTHPEWNPDDVEWDRFKAMLKQYSATDRKGEPLALTGGGTATVVSLSLKDLLPDQILDRVEANVAAAFRVPPIVLQYLVGLKNSPWSQMEEARRSVTQDLLVPMWTRDQKKLTAQLLRAPVEPGREPLETDPMRHVRFDTSDVAALQPDRRAQAETAEKMTTYARVRDLRQLAGLEPLDDSDERNDVIPGLVSGAPAPAGDGDEATDGDEAAETRSAPYHLDTKAHRDIAWYDFDLFTKAEAPAWIAPALKALNGQREKIEDLAAKLLPETEGAIDPAGVRDFLRAADAYLDADGMATLKAALEPLVGLTAQRAVERMGRKLGISFDVLEPGLLAYTAAESAFLITSVTDTTKAAVRSALSQSLEAGESIGKMTARLADLGFDRDRAKLIARTETTRVTNGAQRKSLDDWSATTGQTVRKTWLSSRDVRVRDSHAALDGDTVGIDEPFANGLTEPSEPNCRCSLTYEVED